MMTVFVVAGPRPVAVARSVVVVHDTVLWAQREEKINTRDLEKDFASSSRSNA